MTAICQIPKGAKVLVTGATGFTGSRLTRKLVEGGLAVRAIARPSSDLAPLSDLPIEWLRGDVSDPAVVNAAADGVEYVFHMATAYREGGSSEGTFRKVHVDSTRLLAEKALATPGFKRFVHVSTVGVHGHVEGGPASEEYRFSPGDAYQATKAEAELWLRDFGKRTGLPFTVIRPAAIYGPGDRRLLKLFKMAARGWVFLLGRGRSYYHLVHVDDLANVMILAASHPAALGEAFICGNETPTTVPQICRIIAAALGRGVRIVRLPAWPFFAAAAVCEAVCRPLGIEPPLYRRRVAFFTKDRLFDTQKLRDRLGYRMQHPCEQGLAETARWYVEHGWL